MLDNPNAVTELAQLLKETGDAHKVYEKQELGGKTDDKWAGWYADYLLKNDVKRFFEEALNKEDLAEDLKEAAEAFEQQKSDTGWHEFYAQFMINDYT
jgi:hypothetical protein